jgi:DNA replication protein DnaC
VPLCAGCSDALARRVQEQRAEKEAVEQLAARARRVERLRTPLLTIPAHYQGVSFELEGLERRVQRQQAIADARRAVDDSAALITLIGAAGSGKTTLASAILDRVVQRALAGDAKATRLAPSARWVAAPALACARRKHSLGTGEATLVQLATDASLIVLDDLGMEHDDRDGGIVDVLYERHANDAPTVVTTNLSYDELCDRYGAGIARRVAEAGVTAVIRCDQTKLRRGSRSSIVPEEAT